MKNLKEFIKESCDVSHDYEQECYFNWEGDEQALKALEDTIKKLNTSMCPRVAAEIVEKDDPIVFTIYGEDYDDVEEYGNQLHQEIDKKYQNKVDVWSSEIE